MTFINMEPMNNNEELSFDALNTVNGGQLHFNAQSQRTLCDGKDLTPGEEDKHSAMMEEIRKNYANKNSQEDDYYHVRYTVVKK